MGQPVGLLYGKLPDFITEIGLGEVGDGIGGS
jgi:hypothetical protein